MQLNCGYDPIVGADHVRDSALANKEALPDAPACHDPELAAQGRLIAGMARSYKTFICSGTATQSPQVLCLPLFLSVLLLTIIPARRLSLYTAKHAYL